MKVIDLLNKIANGEKVPQVVSYEGKKYHIDELEHFYVSDDRKALLEYIFDYLNDFDALMTEVEILEEEKKIPEKLETYKENDDEDCYANILKVSKNGEYEIDEATSVIVDKINGIIDYLKSKGE